MNTKRKVGIILGSVLAVLVVGGMGALVLEEGVKAEYAQANEWRNSEEGMINTFCHSAGINWNTCVNNAMVIKAFDGSMKVMMPITTPGVGYVNTNQKSAELCEELVANGKAAQAELIKLWQQGETDPELEKIKHIWRLATERTGMCSGY